MIIIHTLENIVEASAVRAALEAEGIKFIIRTFDDRAYNGIFTPQKGYGQVLVKEEDTEKAKELISSLSP